MDMYVRRRRQAGPLPPEAGPLLVKSMLSIHNASTSSTTTTTNNNNNNNHDNSSKHTYYYY